MDVLHISFIGGRGTHFSVFLRPLRRSVQLRAAIPPPAKLSPRREKKADVSVQSRGQMDGRHCGVCGNRIYSAAAIWTCYARTHPSNFVSALPAVPTVVQRTFARFGRVSSSCAHGAGRGGGAVVPWHGGTDCTCLRPRRSQREATAARCHSRVHTVWDRKKGRCTPVQVSSGFNFLRAAGNGPMVSFASECRAG